MIRTLLLAGCGLLAWTGSSHATIMATASLYSPAAVSGTVTAIDVSKASTPAQTTITGAGYAVSFATDSSQGVVHGSLGGAYALPVAGIFNGAATYLTGGYGSAQTTSADLSGNYLSTGGGGSITVTFTAVQNSLALLWGSIDGYNSISFLDASGNVEDTLAGSTVQALANGFVGNGYQGAGGSAYVTAAESLGFTSVRFDSVYPSFEFAGVAATTGIFYVPEPLSLALFASGLVMAGLIRLRPRRTTMACPVAA